MRKFWKSLFSQECEHKHTLIVSSVGVRRTVCEECGNISFRMAPNLAQSQNIATADDLPKVSGF